MGTEREDPCLTHPPNKHLLRRKASPNPRFDGIIFGKLGCDVHVVVQPKKPNDLSIFVSESGSTAE